MKVPSECVRDLSDRANDFGIDKHVPIRRYFRSGREMLKMGDVYYEESNLEKAYTIYVKYLTLFVERLQNHPEYAKSSSEDKKMVRLESRRVMDRSEKIKASLLQQYEVQYKAWVVEEEARQIQEQLHQMKMHEEEQKKKEDLVKRYQGEKDKAAATRKDHEAALLMQNQLDREFDEEETKEAIRRSQVEDGSPPQPLASALAPIPDRASKPLSNDRLKVSMRKGDDHYGPPAIVPDRSSKPKLSQKSLRELIIPSIVMSKFLSFAESNTSQDKETGAFLAGKMARDVLQVTHIIVPSQTGKSDSFITQGEEDMWRYLETHELLTLGWIHTHPSQTAFLSSVDLHMHFSNQVLLDEAIAIVCAPTYNETGFFTLTPTGMKVISNCQESGFHPHPKEPPLFEEGYHVTVNHELDVVLVDLHKS